MNCAVAYALCITASIIGINAWKDLRTGIHSCTQGGQFRWPAFHITAEWK